MNTPNALNTYRVDRATGAQTPCGMNSILYVGSSQRKAEQAFLQARPGLGVWNEPSPKHGVILSIWTPKGYQTLASKFKETA